MSQQNKKHSLIEALTNTFVGMFISFCITQWWLEPSVMKNIGLTLILTLVSVLRGYMVRRAYNYFHTTPNKKILSDMKRILVRLILGDG